MSFLRAISSDDAPTVQCSSIYGYRTVYRFQSLYQTVSGQCLEIDKADKTGKHACSVVNDKYTMCACMISH